MTSDTWCAYGYLQLLMALFSPWPALRVQLATTAFEYARGERCSKCGRTLADGLVCMEC